MDPAIFITIAAVTGLNLMLTVSVHLVFYFSLRPRIDRRVAVKLAHADRRTQAYKRQTIAAVDKAVEGFTDQSRFVDERTAKVAEECIQALRVTRREILEDVRQMLGSHAGDEKRGGRPSPATSVREILNRAEERLAEKLREEAMQPNQG